MRREYEMLGATSDSITAALTAAGHERRAAIQALYNDAIDRRDAPLKRMLEMTDEYGFDNMRTAWRVVTMLYDGSRP